MMATASLTSPPRGDGIFRRAFRSSAFTTLGYFASQGIRLASNLILTRLLFPEAFGMMALVSVVIAGLVNFSDAGTLPAIQQSRRGDDPAFLNTAWTIHWVRGLLLWVAICLLAWPLSDFYAEPMLLQLLPVAGLALLIGGFSPTRVETAHRHLSIGLVTALDLASQVVGVVSMVVLAWAMQSVWALVIGGLLATIAKLALFWLILPGERNRPMLEPAAMHELLHFGKWIFLATVCGFLIAQGDKIVLGKYLTLDLFGIYNIGYFLASFPLILAGTVTRSILIPLYRERPAVAAPDYERKIRTMRFVLSGGIMAMLGGIAFLGVWLVGLLYDPRFGLAGPIVVVIAVMQIPQAIGLTYDLLALAAGDSRRFFLLLAPKAAVQTLFLAAGVIHAGLLGALVGQGLATIVVYPLVVRLARRYGAWDPLHDAAFAVLGVAMGGLALWMNWDAVIGLAMP